jgi:hypothetical protein
MTGVAWRQHDDIKMTYRSTRMRTNLHTFSICPEARAAVRAALILLLALTPSRERAEASPKTVAKGVLGPMFLSDDSLTPSAILRIERIFTDHQRKGFFKIGILPMLIAEGVVLDVEKPAKLQESLERIPPSMKRNHASGTIELRRVTIQLRSEPQASLRVGRMRPVDGLRAWQLFDPVWRLGTNSVRAAQGELRLSEHGSTELRLNCESGVVLLTLFCPVPLKTQSTITAEQQ